MEESRWAAVSHRQKNAFRHIRRIQVGKRRPLMEVNKHQYVLVMQNNEELTETLKKKQEELTEAEQVSVERDHLCDQLREMERVRELLRHEVSQVKDRSANYQKEIGQLQGNVREKDRRIHELENEKQKVERTAEWKMKRRYDTAERDWGEERQGYAEQITNLEVELMSLREEKQVLKDRVISNENELFILRENENRLTSRVKVLSRDHSAVIGAKSHLDDKISNVEKTEKVMKNRQEKLQRKLDQLKEDKTKLKATLKLKSKQLKDCETYKGQFSSLKSSTDQTLEQLKTQIQSCLETIDQKSANIKMLEQEKAKLTNELSENKEELLKAQTEFQRKLFDVQRTHEESREALKQARHEGENLKTDNENQAKEITKMSAELEQLRDSQLVEKQRIQELQTALTASNSKKHDSSSESDSGSSGTQRKHRRKRKKKLSKNSNECSVDKEEVRNKETAVSDEQPQTDSRPIPEIVVVHKESDQELPGSRGGSQVSIKETEQEIKTPARDEQYSEKDSLTENQDGDQDGDRTNDGMVMQELAAEFGDAAIDSDEESMAQSDRNQNTEVEVERYSKDDVDEMINNVKASYQLQIEELNDEIQTKQNEIEQLQITVFNLHQQLQEQNAQTKNARPTIDSETKEKIQFMRDTIRRAEAKILEKDLALHELRAKFEELSK